MKDMKEINTKNIITAYKQYKETVRTADSYRKRALLYAPDDARRQNYLNREKEYRKIAREDEKTLETAAEKLNLAIIEAEKRCTVRCIGVYDICKTLIEIEQRLNITKKSMEGVRIFVDYHAQNFPNAYKYRPESTVFEAVYRKGSWRITDIRRGGTKRSGHGIKITLTEEAQKAVLDRLTEY